MTRPAGPRRRPAQESPLHAPFAQPGAPKIRPFHAPFAHPGAPTNGNRARPHHRLPPTPVSGMIGARMAEAQIETEHASEAATSPVARQAIATPGASGFAQALGGGRAGASVGGHAAALGRLSTDAARRDYVGQLGRAYGNRHAARVLARRETTEGLQKIAQKSKDGTGGSHWINAHRLAWELIHAYCPEKGVALAGSTYEAALVGFRLDGKMIVIGDDAVNRAAAGNVDAVGKELKTLLATLSDPFGVLSAGGVSEATAPVVVTIPLVLDTGMDTAWSKSFPKGKSQEQGGVLVTDKAGEYVFKAGKPGKSGSFDVNRGDVKKGETLVSIAHTHPYDASEGGFTDVSFSGQDIGLMALNKEKMSFVRSGDGDFLMARTTEFDALVKKAKSKNALFLEIRKHWTGLYKTGTGDLKAKARAATRATCLKYHLLLYEGSKGYLTQPQEMVDARKTTP